MISCYSCTRTRAPDNADLLIQRELARSGRAWGRFDIRFDRGGSLKIIALMMNLRSRLTGIATGDQAVFVTRAAFDAVVGFPSIPLMEDVALSARIKRISRPVCIRAPVTTSARRWRKHWDSTHSFSDVAAQIGILLRHRPCATRTPLRLCLRRAIVPFPSRSWRKPRDPWARHHSPHSSNRSPCSGGTTGAPDGAHD